MKPVGVGVMCLAITLTASHVIAQTVSARDFEQFVEQYMDSVQPGDSGDWKYLLYVEAIDGGTPETVMTRFAERIGVSNATARDYASVILETSLQDERCATDVRGRRPADCVFAPGRRRYDRVASLGRGERSGQLLIAVARSGAFTMQDEAALVALIRTHPAAPAIFARLFERQRDSAYLLALATSGPLPERLSLLAATGPLSYNRWSRQDDARRLALLESVEASAARTKSPVRARAALAELALWWKLELGLIDDAVAAYYAYPADVRASLPLPDGCLDTVERCFLIDRYRLSDELAAALWLTGHTDDARRLLRPAIPNFGRLPAAEARYRALSDAVSPGYSSDDLFPLFVAGTLPGQPKDRPDGRIGFLSPSGNGWVFVARMASPAVRRVIAGRLRTAGYASMASYLDRPDQPLRAAAVDAVLQTVAGMFPRSVNRRQTHWLARIDAAATPPRTQSALAPLRVVVRRPPAWWTERRLPASTTAWRDADARQAPPDNTDLPVDRNTVLRYEERNGERAIVYLSTDYDLPYLTRTAGIWFARTDRGVWSPPLYLGLQQHFPYVVTPGSRLPLLDGQRLRIEVQLREIDTSAVGFPLLSVLKRSADGLYLDIDLAAVAADRDGDGLTDIAEWRIGLDFSRADTDGDGVFDGRDPLPLVAYRSAAATEQLAHAIVTTIFRDEPGPTVVGVTPTLNEAMTGDRRDEAARTGHTRFLVGDPDMFAGLATSFPLIVYSRADMAALDRGGAPFYPAQVTHIFSSLDGRTHHVGWSAAGTGGAFVVTCETPGEACNVKTTGMWTY